MEEVGYNGTVKLKEDATNQQEGFVGVHIGAGQHSEVKLVKCNYKISIIAEN